MAGVLVYHVPWRFGDRIGEHILPQNENLSPGWKTALGEDLGRGLCRFSRLCRSPTKPRLRGQRYGIND